MTSPDLATIIGRIRPLDPAALAAASLRQERLTKPSGSMGALEDLGNSLCGMYAVCPPPLPAPVAVVVFAGDHGVHAQGVSPWPQDVTAQMVANISSGGAVVNAIADQVSASVTVIDVGVAVDLPPLPGVLDRKVAAGTQDLSTGPAMSPAQALAAVEVGIETALGLVGSGHRLLVTGD
ncbi:MAG: nicotinate-nucleotide--dimethylbenzimidazole phosphoribosyltransferase, partial [Actinomycetota bacterium]|nr:nicotinate-nucleotide--dimethylbenzimidazole phosphoribosyltransferase [Actinomycetota bacterium]